MTMVLLSNGSVIGLGLEDKRMSEARLRRMHHDSEDGSIIMANRSAGSQLIGSLAQEPIGSRKAKQFHPTANPSFTTFHSGHIFFFCFHL